MKRKKYLAVFIGFTLLLGCTGISAQAAEAETAQAGPAIVNLKTDGLTDPVGIDSQQPAFSWQMQSDEIGAAQSAYHIVVQDDAQNTVWDSGVVESAVSNEILYEGETLNPSSQYTWNVTVTDQNGTDIQSGTASFETSLLDSTFEAWDGAQWIGSAEQALDAPSKAVFRISADVQLKEGSSTASFILGADDFRLDNQVFNPWKCAGENYVRVEIDFANAAVNAYRCGYNTEEDPEVPFFTIAENEERSAALTSQNQYDVNHVEIFCSGRVLTMTIDDLELAKDTITVNPAGSSETNTFPHLNCVGFAANAGEAATFTDYTIENAGTYGRGILLNETTGPAYSIFENLEGISVDGGTITADGGDEGILVYADPSYGAAPMLRTSFEADSEIARARLYLTAHGIYDFYINGREVAPDEWFNPGSTEYDSILAYNIYDVTEYLEQGENVMGAVLGEGWWTGMMTFETLTNNYYGDQPSLMAKLVVDYADGESDTFVTDAGTWKCFNDGPVRLASMFQGERYDASLEAAVAGWNEAGFDDSAWDNAAEIEIRPQFASPSLVTRKDVPVHVIRVLTAAQLLGETKEGSGSYIYDMGENVSGVPLITIPEEYAKPGETITVRFAEILYPELEEYTAAGVDGMLMVENLRSALVTDFYTMKEGENIFAPDLTFHGYRYIEITGLDEPLPAECVQMQVLSSLDVTAEYESSNELVNRLFNNIVNSTTSNYISIPTDCPQRDERMGWTGDAQIFALSGSYIADTYNFMRQWMDTVRAGTNKETGISAQYAPSFAAYDVDSDAPIDHTGLSFGITWNALAVTIPYNLYMQTGNLGIVRDNIENIYTYVDHLIDTPLGYKNADGDKLEDPRLTGETGTLGDHLSRALTDSSLVGNAVFAACLDEAAVLADAVGDADKAQEYRDAAEEAREGWNERFIDPETGKTQNAKGAVQDTQASYATALRFHVISDENLEKALENYYLTISEPDLTDRDGLTVPPYSITTGFNATGNVLNALSDYNMNDTAYRLFESTEYASWLYPVTQGATSIWERWNGYTNELGFNGNNSMNSFNHYSLGAVYEWMISYQLGIKADPAQPGYKHFILQPTPGGTFTYANGSFDSVYGTIRSGWTAQDGKMTSYDATVPANTSATLYLPVSGEVSACEGVEATGSAVHNSAETTQIELAAGSYHFDISADSITVTAN